MTPEQSKKIIEYYNKHNNGWGVLPVWVHGLVVVLGTTMIAFVKSPWSYAALVLGVYSACEIARRSGHREGYFEGARDGDEIHHPPRNHNIP